MPEEAVLVDMSEDPCTLREESRILKTCAVVCQVTHRRVEYTSSHLLIGAPDQIDRACAWVAMNHPHAVLYRDVDERDYLEGAYVDD